MVITIKRKYLKDTYTIGHLYIDGEYVCDTLEDTVRKIKIPGKTAIFAGTYEVQYSWSFRFKKNLPRLLNVPNFSGVLIHAGNTARDTAGCILVGLNKSVGTLEHSRKCLNEIIRRIEDANKRKESIKCKIVYI